MKRILFFLISTAIFATAQPAALFYMNESPASLKSFSERADKVDVLVPAWYTTDGSGVVQGSPSPDILKPAAAHHVPVMPIVALMTQSELRSLRPHPRAAPSSPHFSPNAINTDTPASRSTSKM